MSGTLHQQNTLYVGVTLAAYNVFSHVCGCLDSPKTLFSIEIIRMYGLFIMYMHAITLYHIYC